MSTSDPTTDVRELALRAREASYELALATRATKDGALHAMADALLERGARGAGGQRRGRRARRGRRHAGQRRRPAAADRRAARPAMAQGLRDVAALPDPVGEVVRGSTLANGLELRQVRVPFGVVGMIYEARPNVTADAAGICLKSGNAVLLRGSGERARRPTPRSSRCCATRSPAPGCRPTRCSWCPADSHDTVKALMRARGLVDVLIPRGGAGLIALSSRSRRCR